MKLKVLLFGVCFASIMAYGYSAKAEVMCDTIVVDCGDGPVTNALICGENGNETVAAAREAFAVICG